MTLLVISVLVVLLVSAACSVSPCLTMTTRKRARMREIRHL